MRRIIIAISLIFLMIGCVPSFKEEILSICKEKGYTENQAIVIYHAVLVKELMVVDKDDGSRQIKYDDYLTAEEALININDMIESIDSIFLPENYATKIGGLLRDYPKIKKDLEKERIVLKFLSDRVTGLKTYNKFKELKLSQDPDKYFLGVIDPSVDIKDKFKFICKNVEEKRNDGKGGLKKIEDLAHSFYYEVRKQDPKYPNDKNRFIYEGKTINLNIKVYDTGNDHTGDYVEVFRGSESSPAMKLFKDESGSLSIAVIDRDTEGTFGYMIPDVVKKVYGIPKSNIAVYLSKDDTFIQDLYFEEKTKDKDIKPHINDNKLFFVKAGGLELKDEYEINKEGWTVPVEYKNATGSNFKQYAVMEKPGKELLAEAKENKSIVYGKIKYIVKKYHSFKSEYLDGMGNVIEYYKPLPGYSNRVITSIFIKGKKLEIDKLGEQTVIGFPSLFAYEKPYIIQYSEGSNKWDFRYKLIDMDDDGKYESRKKIANNSAIECNGDKVIKEKSVPSSYGHRDI